MADQADEISLKKLTLDKQIYRRATRYSKSNNPADRVISVILYDLANETMLNIVMSHIDPSRKPESRFPQMLEQIDGLLALKGLGRIPNRENILRIHKIRNDAQHDARVPSESDQGECMAYCRDFLRNISRQVWGIEFDGISLADLIRNKAIRQHLVDAERLLKEEEFKASVEKSSAALERSIGMVSESIVGTLPAFDNQVVTSDVFGSEHKPNREYSDAIERMRRTMSFLALNINYMEYLQFHKISGEPLWSLGSVDPVKFYGQKEDITAGDAEFALSFATDSILATEGFVGDLDSPFGHKRAGL